MALWKKKWGFSGILLLGVEKAAAIFARNSLKSFAMQVIVSFQLGGKTTDWRCGNRNAVESYIVNGWEMVVKSWARDARM